jgi:hypothetical protein
MGLGRDDNSASSNFHELKDLVIALEDGVSKGALHQTEVFIFTHNTTVERAYYKGITPCKHLFQAVSCLCTMEMVAELILHVIHLSSTRMIAQVTDGLLHGMLTEGIFAIKPSLWEDLLH